MTDVGQRELTFFRTDGVFGSFRPGLILAPIGLIGAGLAFAALRDFQAPLILQLVLPLLLLVAVTLLVGREVSSIVIEADDVIFVLPRSNWRIPRRSIQRISFHCSPISNVVNFWVHLDGRSPTFLHAMCINMTCAELSNWMEIHLSDRAPGN